MGVKGAHITEIFKSLQGMFDESQFQVSEAILTASVRLWRVSVSVRANARLRSSSQPPAGLHLGEQQQLWRVKASPQIPPNQLSGWTALLKRACEAVWSHTVAPTLRKPNGITGSFSSTLRLFDRFSPVSRQIPIPNCLYLFNLNGHRWYRPGPPRVPAERWDEALMTEQTWGASQPPTECPRGCSRWHSAPSVPITAIRLPRKWFSYMQRHSSNHLTSHYKTFSASKSLKIEREAF